MKEQSKETINYSFPKQERILLLSIGILIIISGCILAMYEFPDPGNIFGGVILVFVGFAIMLMSQVESSKVK